ncbi:hypothetical protein [Agrobacterium radiobacter]|uniref:hypothetical protein n=1 Tax=Agrobacterium radiobacter TaxID=362 RepID=UPI003F85C37F
MTEYFKKTEPLRKSFRDAYVYCRMRAINSNYYAYDADLTREMQTTGFSAAVTNIALTSVASQISAVKAKDILSATAAGLTGVKAAYDKDILVNRTVQLIQSQMHASRVEVGNRIISRLKLPVEDYPLMLALIDLQDYYQAGTFGNGLNDVRDAIGERTLEATSTRDMVIVRGASASDPQIQALHAFLYGGTTDGKVNPNRFAYLQSLLKNQSKVALDYLAGEASPSVRSKLLECANRFEKNRCAAGTISNP